MEKIKQCAACRYCRVHTAIKTSALLLVTAVVSIIVLFDGRI